MLSTDAPFVLRNSPRRFVLQSVLGLVLLAGCALSLAAFGVSVVLVLGVLVGAGALVLSVRALRDREPAFTADADGVAFRALRGADSLRRLRWDELEAVYVHRMARNFHLLCIRPADLEAERAWAGAEAANLDRSIELVGAPYAVNLTAAGVGDDEALDRLRMLAGGRTRVGER